VKKKSVEETIPYQNETLNVNKKTNGSYFDKTDAKFLLQIIGSIHLAIAVFSKENKFLYANEAFSSLFGFQPDSYGQLATWLEIACPEREYRQAVQDLWKRSVSDVIHEKPGFKNKREIKFFSCSGDNKVIEISFHRINNYIVVSFEDITEKKNTENKLRQQIEFSNKIALTSPVGIITTELDGKIIFANNKAVSILKINRSKLKKLYYNIEDFKISTITNEKFREEDLPLSIVRKTLKPVFDIKHTVETSDEGKIFLRVNASPILACENEPIGMIVVFEDITESVEAEHQMKENYNFRNAILNNVAEGLCVGHECRHFPYIKFTVWNNQMYKLTGFNIEEINKNGVFNNLYPDPDWRKKAIERLKKMREGDDLQNEEWIITRKDGQKRIVTFSATTINKKDNEPYIMALMNDVTEKRKQEEEINQINQELKEAQRIGKIGNWIHYFKQNEIYWSDQIYRIFGYKPEEDLPLNIIDRHIAVIFRKEYLVLISELQRTNSETKSKVLEFKIENKHNEIKYVILKSEIILDGSGNRIGAKGTLQDITEAKVQELKLKDLNNTKDKMFSIIAHDLKNPIGVMVGLSELLEESIDSKDFESIERYGRIFSLSANKSYALLINLLDWSRSQSNKISFSPEQVNLHEVVEEIRVLLSVLFMEKKIQVTVNIDKTLMVFADINMLKAILRNLISNAIKYSHHGGKILIKAGFLKNNIICISVKDNGVGIIDAHQRFIFDSDKQISTHGTDKEKGTGLGLLVCRDFIKRHGENIWFESTYGEGSTFFFTMKMN
jgi:PAS domain S-box-containing protein